MYFDAYETSFTIKDSDLRAYGICSTCKYFRVQFTKHHDEIAWCKTMENGCGGRKPSRKDPITSCSEYYDRTHPEYWEMERMATKIDITIRRKAGFMSAADDSIREVTVKKPKDKGITEEENE